VPAQIRGSAWAIQGLAEVERALEANLLPALAARPWVCERNLARPTRVYSDDQYAPRPRVTIEKVRMSNLMSPQRDQFVT
jgi:hypothetical protein